MIRFAFNIRSWTFGAAWNEYFYALHAGPVLVLFTRRMFRVVQQSRELLRSMPVDRTRRKKGTPGGVRKRGR